MKKFEICLWVHTDIDEPDTTFSMMAKDKEEAQNKIDYMNKNCLSENHRMEVMGELEDEIFIKAEKWDALDEKLGAYYEDGSEGDLCDMGEDAAIAFGYL